MKLQNSVVAVSGVLTLVKIMKKRTGECQYRVVLLMNNNIINQNKFINDVYSEINDVIEMMYMYLPKTLSKCSRCPLTWLGTRLP